MRLPGLLLVVTVLMPTPGQQAPRAGGAPRPVGTMRELMADVIYPTSDAVLYITTRTPASEAEWNVLQTKTLMLAESAYLLMIPPRAREGGGWMREAQAMYDAGADAYRAAKARDVDALAALNDPLYLSCVNCHREYRRGYGR
jgi:hypothetical protein